MKQIKILFFLIGLAVSSLSFGSKKEGGAVSSEVRRELRQGLTDVIGAWFSPPEKNWGSRSLQKAEAKRTLANTLFGKRFKLRFKLFNDYEEFFFRGDPETVTVGFLKNHMRKKLGKPYGLFYFNEVENELRPEDDKLSLKEAGIKSGSVVTLFPEGSKEIQMKVMVQLYALVPKGSELRKYDSLESLEKTDISKWPGVKANENGHIIEINLSKNQLSGTIPKELGNLVTLKNLTLSFNYLTGEVPRELGNLVSLTDFNLFHNKLTGAIPTELGRLTSLERFYLSKNQLTGTILKELGNLVTLKSLSLSDNQLTGAIPTELGNLVTLKSLSLSDNQLTGAIPTELGNLETLQRLTLYYNHLTERDVFEDMMRNKVPGCDLFISPQRVL